MLYYCWLSMFFLFVEISSLHNVLHLFAGVTFFLKCICVGLLSWLSGGQSENYTAWLPGACFEASSGRWKGCLSKEWGYILSQSGTIVKASFYFAICIFGSKNTIQVILWKTTFITRYTCAEQSVVCINWLRFESPSELFFQTENATLLYDL